MPPRALLLANRIHALSSEGRFASSKAVATSLLTLALSASPLPRTSGESAIVDEARLQLQANRDLRLSRANLAALTGAVPTNLGNWFRACQGQPIYRYQLALRLGSALGYLHGCDSIYSVGVAHGFANQSHFSARFRAHFGIGPSECRQFLSSF
jgi:transcriptional regulator GlxA family with amidase domain